MVAYQYYLDQGYQMQLRPQVRSGMVSRRLDPAHGTVAATIATSSVEGPVVGLAVAVA